LDGNLERTGRLGWDPYQLNLVKKGGDCMGVAIMLLDTDG